MVYLFGTKSIESLQLCFRIEDAVYMMLLCNPGQRVLCGTIRHGAGPKTPEGYLQDVYGQEDRVCCQSYSVFPPLDAKA